MSSEQRVALVTGGNRGIGLEVCRGLAKSGYTVICSGRDEANLRQVRKDFAAEGLDVDTIMLDITDGNMIDIKHGENVSDNFIGDWIRRKYGRLDVLVNNAGVVPDGSIQQEPVGILETTRDQFELGFATHFYGPMGVLRGVLPLMKAQNYGRIVNVSTGMARLSAMEAGWAAYRVSKVTINALTAILAKELEGSNILVNAASPGWVKTRMGGEQAELTPEQGADTILWLAQLEDGGPSGGFFAQRQETAW
ncbi:MAG: SDR family oxidoreductase [Nevskiales bacterium]